MEEYKPLLCGLLAAFILFMFFVPNRRIREERRAVWEIEKRRNPRGNSRTASEVIGIHGIMAHRGESTTFLTDIEAQLVHFIGITKGYFSDTVFLVVTGDGKITQFDNEVLAQNAFKKGDYGITAMTMSDGKLTTRDIVPDVIHEDNAYRLQYSFILQTK